MGKNLQALSKKDAEKNISEVIGKHLSSIITAEITSIKYSPGNENKITLEVTIEKKGDMPEKKSQTGVFIGILIFILIIFSILSSPETDSNNTKGNTTNSTYKTND